MKRGKRGVVLVSLSALIIMGLTIALSGCQFVGPTQEPRVTWQPLPTIGPSATPIPPTPTSLPTSTRTPTYVPRPAPTEAPTATVTAEPTEETSSREAASQAVSARSGNTDTGHRAIWARDRAWAYFLEEEIETSAPTQPGWTDDGTEALIGATHYRYRAGEWTMAVAVPVVAPENIVFNIEVGGPNAFSWWAQVARDGSVTVELPGEPAFAAVEAVQSWQGTLHKAQEGAKYNDFFRVRGGAAGEYGIAGADPAMEDRLAALRDSGRIITVWGTLKRHVPDYEGTQIIVERLEVAPPPATPAPESELVEAWVGLVRSAAAGSAYDDYFDAQQPAGQYGIDSLNTRLREMLVFYRDTGTQIRIWGVLDYGVADYGSKRILVTRIQEVGR